jgi:hypothetical protein
MPNPTRTVIQRASRTLLAATIAVSLGLAAAQAFGDPVATGAFASAMANEGAVIGLTSDQDDAQLAVRNPSQIQASLDACTDPGMSFYIHQGERYFFVHGTTFVDNDEYAIMGVRVLTSAANSADLRAQAGAVRYLRGLRVTAAAIDFEGMSSTREGQAGGGGISSVLTSAWERTELQAIASSSTGTLVGGHRIGQRIVVMPPAPATTESAGLCVLVRWSFPLDQQSWSPANATTSESTAPSDAEADEQPPRPSGFVPPPPGVYGNF